jgi:hypothetical protein
MGIEEREEIQTKDIGKLLNKMIAENFLNLEKERNIQVQKLTEHQNIRT